MRNKDTQRRDSDHLVEPSNLDQCAWINGAGDPVKWVTVNIGGRDIGIGAGPKFIVHTTVTVEASTADENAARLPPALGEALLVLVCPRNRAKYVRGDLRETFNEDIKINGKRRAVLLYWSGVLHSIGPLLWVKLRRAGFIALLLEIGRRWSGLS
jgi:hypothetical protein